MKYFEKLEVIVVRNGNCVEAVVANIDALDRWAAKKKKDLLICSNYEIKNLIGGGEVVFTLVGVTKSWNITYSYYKKEVFK